MANFLCHSLLQIFLIFWLLTFHHKMLHFHNISCPLSNYSILCCAIFPIFIYKNIFHTIQTLAILFSKKNPIISNLSCYSFSNIFLNFPNDSVVSIAWSSGVSHTSLNYKGRTALWIRKDNLVKCQITYLFASFVFLQFSKSVMADQRSPC